MIVAQSVAAANMLRKPLVLLQDYEQIGRWLNRNTAPTDTVASCDIGELGWVTQRKIIDIVGLTEPKNARHIAHRDVTSWLEEDKPDYVVVHDVPYVYEKVAVDSERYERTGVHFGWSYVLRRKK